MSNHETGKPSGATKSNDGTGVPGGKFVEDVQKDEELTQKYTEDDQRVADHVRQNNPNRNTEKDDATNAGGYKG